MKKMLICISSAVAVVSASALPAFAATVSLPAEFDNLVPIFETVLKIVEFLSKIISFFA